MAPRIEPRGGAQARQLVVFLHGYGADGNDLIEIGRAWQALLPQRRIRLAACAASLRQAPAGREWFPLTFRDPDERWRGVNAAAPVPRRISRCRTQAAQPAAVRAGAGRLQPGHDDGAACRAAPRRSAGARSSAIPACWCCRPTGRARDRSRREIKSRPPVLLVHGDQDELIPAQALFMAAQALAGARRAGGMAHFRRHRPRHRPGRAAPRRRIPRAAVRARSDRPA